MQTENRLLDDLAKVATGAIGSLTGMRHEVEGRLQQQLERLVERMNLVSREEFEAIRAVAQTAREEQIRLTQRVAELEAQLAQQQPAATTPPQEGGPA